MAIAPLLRNGYGFGSTEFHILRPYEGIFTKFIYYFVSSQRFRADAEHNMTGAVGQRRVPTTYLSEHPIPLPPSGEQCRVVQKSTSSSRSSTRGSRASRLPGNNFAFTARLPSNVRSRASSRLNGATKTGTSWEPATSSLTASDESANFTTSARSQNGTVLLKIARRMEQAGKNHLNRAPPESVTSLTQEAIASLERLPPGWIWEKFGWMTCGVNTGQQQSRPWLG